MATTAMPYLLEVGLVLLKRAFRANGSPRSVGLFPD